MQLTGIHRQGPEPGQSEANVFFPGPPTSALCLFLTGDLDLWTYPDRTYLFFCGDNSDQPGARYPGLPNSVALVVS